MTKLSVSLMFSNVKLGHITAWVTWRMPQESDHQHYKPNVFYLCKQQKIGSSKKTYHLAQAAEILFTAGVGCQENVLI